MEHFITEIRIENVRHLKNINIVLNNQNRQHLIFTGKNSSGKTSLLEEISKNLVLLNRKLLKSYRDLRILSDLILRMDQNWLLKNHLSGYNKEGVVLIDEIETHLYIELQRKILPFLTEFFPRLQFIVSTYSPYVLTSISNVVVFDLERQVALTDLSEYSTEDIANGFFEADSYSVEMEKILNRYKEFFNKQDISDDEHTEKY
mgnify:CR=1 FL=1